MIQFKAEIFKLKMILYDTDSFILESILERILEKLLIFGIRVFGTSYLLANEHVSSNSQRR